MQALLAALLGVAMVSSGMVRANADNDVRLDGLDVDEPNVIFVLVDDLSENLLPYMSEVQALAADGVTFSNYFNATPWCCPSRASLQTGKYPHNTKVRTNLWPNGGFEQFLINDVDSSIGVQMQAQGAGYRTGFMGKYLNGYKTEGQSDPTRPTYGAGYVPPGWDTWFSGTAYQHFTYDMVESVDGSAATNPTWQGEDASNYYTDVLSDRAQSFLATDSVDPFFLMLAPFAPHAGIGRDPEGDKVQYPPAPRDRAESAARPPSWGEPEFRRGDCGPVRCQDIQWPASTSPSNFNTVTTERLQWMASTPLTPRELKKARSRHVERIQMVQSVDDMVGALMQTLADTGRLDDTWVVFGSDNGYHLGEHALFAGKTTAYDHDVRTPLIARPPGGTGAPVTVDALVQNVDIVPTLLDIAGGVAPADVDGVSMLPLMSDPTLTWRAGALFELTNDGPAARYFNPDLRGVERQTLAPTYNALRTEEYLYVDYSALDDTPATNAQAEFYDLTVDPGQVNNRYPELPAELREALSAEVRRQTACTGSQCWAEQLTVPLLH